jgi:hypothetical protein
MRRTVRDSALHSSIASAIVLVGRYIKDALFRITLAVVVDLQPGLSPSVNQPAVITITHNRKDPGARIPATISSEASIGSKECLLYDILGRVGISAEKTREIVGGVELRNDILLKSGKGSIPARLALHQQSQLVQCRRWCVFYCLRQFLEAARMRS